MNVAGCHALIFMKIKSKSCEAFFKRRTSLHCIHTLTANLEMADKFLHFDRSDNLRKNKH